MSFNNLTVPKIGSTKIRISTLVDWLSIMCIILFSAHDCLVRLFPVFPYSSSSCSQGLLH